MKSIGGYIELELTKRDSVYHSTAIALNSARAAFEYYLLANNIQKVYVPYFMCEVMLQPLVKHNIAHQFYCVDSSLEIQDNITIQRSECLLYINYFDQKDEYISKLATLYGADKLVIDCTQSFFYKPPTGISALYSARKFFGVPDGGLLYCSARLKKTLPTSTSHHKMQHLLGRIDDSAEAFYPIYQDNEQSFDDSEMASMSALTHHILASIDYETTKNIRQHNFSLLHTFLAQYNQFPIVKTGCYMYPLFIKNGESIRRALIEKKIYCPVFWPELLGLDVTKIDLDFIKNVVCLPIDQRYNEQDMKTIVDAIEGLTQD